MIEEANAFTAKNRLNIFFLNKYAITADTMFMVNRAGIISTSIKDTSGVALTHHTNTESKMTSSRSKLNNRLTRI